MMKSESTTFRGLRTLTIAWVALLVTGCTTVSPPRVTEFGQGVDKVKVQFDTAFTTINAMITEDEIDSAITAPTLTEEEVGVVLKGEDIAKWDAATSEIDQYVTNLGTLLSPDRPNDFSKALVDLGTEVKSLDPNLLPSPGVAAGFAELGRILIESKAQTDALRIARATDPAMQQIFTEMATAIGDDHSKGLRGTVYQHWILRMAIQRQAFLTANDKPDVRRTIVMSFIALRDQRDAQDLQLASLHQSLMDLAAAHAALARGSDTDLATALAMIQQELTVTRTLYDQFNALEPTNTKKKE